ncbi:MULTISPECIES: DUF3173 family protein [unclassified Enterococcus]|uniref:DUF3173 family protein n=1 Tax=unclassified Enterococcus TaxID=2608891 RepID=UPI000A34C71F|nr:MULTISPECIES: DUF3173 family protein [unclassified Enterococcus]KAF1304201.1 hypothetical protein BAU16_02295 [Enterococcus sp. JM9B]OTO76905.1 hypothetical protein A5865_000778 [Enterococcus sp. 12E11_DIV0728]OUZ16936.1 hypothetical protein A5868_001860 [Enterococcus sp. 12F9_DIV0723]
MAKLVSKKDLIRAGYSNYHAAKIIHDSKQLLVSKGFSYYKNRRLGVVPNHAIEELIGIDPLESD